MNCSIENIKDENLTKHIEVFGPEQGLITYLDKVAKGESTEVKNPSLIKDGVQELFESNPELANIGTPEQYSQYLDTIFPDSKVKDIVYHGSKEKFDTVDVSKSKFQKGFYFAKDKSIAKGYGNTLPLLVDSKNIQVQPFAHFGYYVDSMQDLEKQLNKLKQLKNWEEKW